MTVSPGYILAAIRSALKESSAPQIAQEIAIDGHQVNGAYCVHQARVRIAGDPTIYRMIIAPANAPIFINDDKRPCADAFPLPLGDI